MKLRKLFSSLLVLCMCAGCTVEASEGKAVSIERNAVLSLEDEDNDETYKEADAVKIELSGESAKASGPMILT